MPTMGSLRCDPARRAVELGVAVGEDAAVGGHQPVAAVAIGCCAHDGLLQWLLDGVTGVAGPAEGHHAAGGIDDGIGAVVAGSRRGRQGGWPRCRRGDDERAGGEQHGCSQSGPVACPPNPCSGTRHESQIVGSGEWLFRSPRLAHRHVDGAPLGFGPDRRGPDHPRGCPRRLRPTGPRRQRSRSCRLCGSAAGVPVPLLAPVRPGPRDSKGRAGRTLTLSFTLTFRFRVGGGGRFGPGEVPVVASDPPSGRLVRHDGLDPLSLGVVLVGATAEA